MIGLRRLAARRRVALTIALAALVVSACEKPREPILVEEGAVTIENLTSEEWRDVKIVVNHHFAGGVPRLEAGGRVNAPLSRFVTAFGQQFDRGRQSVFKVDVTAKDSTGKLVTLTWGSDQRK
jgi:hypothetical protein